MGQSPARLLSPSVGETPRGAGFLHRNEGAILITENYPAPWDRWTRQQYDEWIAHVWETLRQGGIPMDATGWLARFYPYSPVFDDLGGLGGGATGA